jgi:hypothetical protein
MSTTTTEYGMLAEFKHPGALMKAAEKVRDAGFLNWDAYSPFPIHGLDDAMGLKPSKLGWIVILHSFMGFFGGLGLIVFTSGFDYPLNISGKPFLNFPAFVPVTFELTILLSAFGAVFGMFFLNNMPRHNHPLFISKRFSKATDDGFFICIETEDDQYNQEKVEKLLKDAGAIHLELVQGQ